MTTAAMPGWCAARLSGGGARDGQIIDYRMVPLAGTGLTVRGPLPDLEEPYFVCLGAAGTFGCFCAEPYPAIVGTALGLPALNLGHGGAGPDFFLRREALLAIINRARFAVIEVMPAGGHDDAGAAPVDRPEGVVLREASRSLGMQGAFEALIGGPTGLPFRLPLPHRMRRLFADALARPDPRLPALVREIQHAWIASSLTLLARIEVPKVLLWFSRRRPAGRQRYGTAATTLGAFPHLVTAPMIERLRPRVSAYAECVSSRGAPGGLPGGPGGGWPHHPSPQMHEDAARALLATLSRIRPDGSRHHGAGLGWLSAAGSSSA